MFNLFGSSTMAFAVSLLMVILRGLDRKLDDAWIVDKFYGLLPDGMQKRASEKELVQLLTTGKAFIKAVRAVLYADEKSKTGKG